MKNSKLKFLVLGSLAMMPSAFAASPLTGTYQAIDSAGCLQKGISSAHVLQVSTTSAEIKIVQEDIQKLLFDFQVGKWVSPPSTSLFNEFLTQIEGSFSAGGSQFKLVQSTIDRLNPIPEYAGEIDFDFINNFLVITDTRTTSGFQPSLPSRCLLKAN